MKRRLYRFLLCAAVLCLSCAMTAGAVWAETEEYTVFTLEGPAGSAVSYPMLIANSVTADHINQRLMEKAHIDDYIALMDRITEGGTGLRVTCDVAMGDRVYSVLITAEGKMLSGPPAKVYYPMTFDLSTGEEIPFEALFRDADQAKAIIENVLSEQVEPQLSTYLENNALFPAPYDRYALDGQGHITLYYEKSQLSFLSGGPGAVAFRLSELWDVLRTEPDAPCMDVQRGDYADQYAPTRRAGYDFAGAWKTACAEGRVDGITKARVGQEMEQALSALHAAADSGYYPGGAYYETEHPALRGAYLLTDEQETTVTGLLTANADSFGIETGKTPLSEAISLLGAPSAIMNLDAETAESYLVCPGQAAVWAVSIRPDEEKEAVAGTYTLYADLSGIVRYIKLSYMN